MRDIFRAFVKAGVGSGANMVVSLLRSKLLALYLGPQGMGMVSLLQQFQSTLSPIVTLGGDAPLVQGLAAREGSERHAFLASAFAALLLSWSICVLAIAMGGQWFGPLLLGEQLANVTEIVPFLAIPILLTAVSSFLLALLTTVGAVGSLQKAQLLGNLAGLVVAVPLGLAWKHGNQSLLVVYFAATPLLSLCLALWYIGKIPEAGNLLHRLRVSNIKPELIRRYLAFGGVTILTGVLVTSTWLIIRREVLHALGGDSLGYFSATLSLSSMGLNLVSTALFSFYMPRFASADSVTRPRILKAVLGLVMPLAATVFIVLQFFPNQIVALLFSERFLPMVPLLKWWVAGDLIRAVSCVFAVPIIACAHMRFFLVSEILFSGLILGFFMYALTLSDSLVNLGKMYVFIYGLYLVTTIVFARIKGYF